jgi:DNA-binding NtrC family response regulator
VTRRVDLDREALVERLAGLIEKLTPEHWEGGERWYPAAREIIAQLADQTGQTPERCAAVVSHLSPRLRWEKNVDQARTLIQTGTVAGMGRGIRKARAALEAEDPMSTFTGNKTTHFVRALTGDDQAVTVDVWIMRAVEVTAKDMKKAHRYQAVVAAITEVADSLGVTPATLQAAIWLYMRGQ